MHPCTYTLIARFDVFMVIKIQVVWVKIEATRSFEMSVSHHITKQHHNPEDHNLKTYLWSVKCKYLLV